MSLFLKFILAGILSVLAILLGVVLGDYGPWYLAWVLGTGLMVLVAAMGGVLFEAQEDAREQQAKSQPARR